MTWRPINASLQHGIILGYRIYYEKDMNVPQRRKRRSLQSFDVTVLGQNNLTWVIEELEKFTNYCIEIVGFNRKGDGKQSNWVCTMTDEDGKIEPFLTLTTDSGTHPISNEQLSHKLLLSLWALSFCKKNLSF